MRPVDDDASGADNSDDLLSDEELALSSDSLLDALRTRIGGVASKDTNASDNQYKVTDHHANSSAAVQLGQEAWANDENIAQRNQPEFTAPTAMSDILKAARTSQKQDLTADVTLRSTEREAGVRSIPTATVAQVQEWLEKLKTRRNEKGKLVANAEQFAVVNEVACTVMEEIDSTATDDAHVGEPLRKLVHGGPGTGKTHVIKLIKELFEDVLGWQQGVQFQVVAFQAVMAHLIGGDTIHHALGIPVFTDGRSSADQVASHMAVAKRMLQCRWLIIDEISMVSSQLLALVDMKLREVVRDLVPAKRDETEVARPCGGLNVLLLGDFWQLPPPSGGCLSDIPVAFIQGARQYQPSPTVVHGQALMWGGKECGLQGVIELTQVERCKDAWLGEVQQQVRHGCLSEDNWNFLHGEPTIVPGSWARGRAQCGQPQCQALGESKRPKGKAASANVHPSVPMDMAGRTRTPAMEVGSAIHGSDVPRSKRNRSSASTDNETLQVECKSCKAERLSKARVAANANDPRFQSEKFSKATAIFAHNDVKYDTNKTRAKLFAARQNEGIVYSVAKDTPSQDAPRERLG